MGIIVGPLDLKFFQQLPPGAPRLLLEPTLSMLAHLDERIGTTTTALGG
ncbi:hypothetical protein ACVWYO_004705 [Sphingomonas sp. UYP23]